MPTEDQSTLGYLINGREVVTHDATLTATQILNVAGFEPAEDYVLIARTAHGTRVVDLDTTLELQGEQKEFFASSNGLVFELTVDGHSIYWGEKHIDISDIRRFANVPEDDDLLWVREGDTDVMLSRTGNFDLGEQGVEHIQTCKRAIHPQTYVYFVDATEYQTDHAELTGAQITALIPAWNPQNSLVLEGEGSEPDEVIHPTTVVVFKGRLTPAHFTIVPPATFGSACV